MNGSMLPVLAGLFRYPDADYHEDLQQACRRFPNDEHALHRFARRVSGQSVEQLQELFTQTFDMSKTCALEVGWHLYGEEYERGRFLATLRGLLREHAITESTELPDHLTHVLLLLDRLPAVRRDELARNAVLPALAKVRNGVEQKSGPYIHLVECVHAQVEAMTDSKKAGGNHE